MSAIEHSLRNMLAAIERLDHAAGTMEDFIAGRQRDMFAAPPSKNTTQDAILARRLDVAIQRVEELLEET